MLHLLRGKTTPREGAGPLPALHSTLLQANRPQRAEKGKRSLMRMITTLLRSLGNLFGSRRRALGAGGLLGLVVIVPTFALMMQTEEAAGAVAVGKIAFTRIPDNVDTRDIYVMNADGSGLTQLTTAGEESFPDWSPDGSKITYESYHPSPSGNTDIYVMNADGSNKTNLTNTPGEGDGVQELSPAWSPDGSKIAFGSVPDGVHFDIYVMNADGSGVTQLTTAGEEFRPAWSPDGSKIAYDSYRDGNFEIYVMNADGSNQTNLTNTPGLFGEGVQELRPAWSPDGSKIAFDRTSDSGNTSDIYVMNADGSGVTQLTTAEGEHNPAWSPDGSKITYDSYHPLDSGNTDIYVMNADGSGQTNLTNTPGQGGDGVQELNPDWGVSAAAPPDTTNPKVGTVAPTNGATGVSRATNVVTTFSEAMNSTTLSKTNVKLYKVTSKGTSEITNVTVAPSADGTSATLNPYGTSSTVLEKNTTYQALVSTGARDLAGNALDQSPSAKGNQPMKWSFKTGG